jgi:hypothetical protein
MYMWIPLTFGVASSHIQTFKSSWFMKVVCSQYSELSYSSEEKMLLFPFYIQCNQMFPYQIKLIFGVSVLCL